MDKQYFDQLYSERENAKSLVMYLSEKLKSIPDESVVRELQIEEKSASEKLVQIETSLRQAGLPLFENNTAKTYYTVNQEINRLESPEDLIDWLLYNSPASTKTKIRELRSRGSKLNSKINGKWMGKSNSNSGFFPGEFSFGVVQLENKVFGYGALLGSIYDRVLVRGLADEDEIRIEIYGESVPEITFFHGTIKSSSIKNEITGNYYISNGYDNGHIEATIEKELIQIGYKTSMLVLLADFREAISKSELNEISSFLTENQNKLDERHRDEMILINRRIHDIIRKKRLQTDPSADIQIEETRVMKSILDFISAVERELKV